MALSIENIPIRVRAALAARGADVSNLRNNRILALIDPALALMAQRVAMSSDYQDLQTDFDVTVTNGVTDLADHPTMLFDLARSEVQTAATGTPFSPIDGIKTLAFADLPTDEIYYTKEGTELRFRSPTPSLLDYDADLKVRANFIPVLSEVPVKYEAHFLNTLLELLEQQSSTMRAHELTA